MSSDNNSVNLGKKKGGGNLTATAPKCRLSDFLASRCFQWVFVFSCVATSAAFTRPSIVSLLCNLLAFAVAYYITFSKKILVHIFSPTQSAALRVAFVFTLFAVGFCVPLLLKILPIILEHLHVIPAHIAVYLLYLTTAPAFFVFFYVFITRFTPFATEIYKTSDKIERGFFVVIMLITLIAVSVIYNQTNCFYAPLGQDGEIIAVDVVYTTDSGHYFKTNVYGFIGAPENDVRQPLFGLFALPFAVVASLLSWVFFIIPNSYTIFVQTIQIGLLLTTYILMSRLMGLSGLTKTLFFIALILTYPVLLFSLVWEQYIFSIFWLGVFIYIVPTRRQSHSLAFIAATGSLLTSATAFLFTCTKDYRQFIRNGIVCTSYFLIFLVLSGRLVECFDILRLFKFAGIKLPFYEKFLQFVNFVTTCWIVPDVVILGEINRVYQLAPVESLNLLGAFLLAFCFLGFVLNYKDKFAQICAFWIAFSFFVLCLVGWGTAENGLILYTLYFGWAYFCLAFLAIEKLLQKLPSVKYAVYTALIAVLAYINLPGIYDLIHFGIEYYPVQ